MEPERRSELHDFLTLEQLATYLQVHPSTIYRLCKKRVLPRFKVGRDWRFSVDAIDAWRREQEAQSVMTQ